MLVVAKLAGQMAALGQTTRDVRTLRELNCELTEATGKPSKGKPDHLSRHDQHDLVAKAPNLRYCQLNPQTGGVLKLTWL
jgi:hypothetical protein